VPVVYVGFEKEFEASITVMAVGILVMFIEISRKS
jgi:hypothetical protein